MSQAGNISCNGSIIIPVTVPNGGTGQVSFPAHTVLLGEGTAPIGNAGPGAVNSVLMGQGAGADPIFVPVVSILGCARASSTTPITTTKLCSNVTTPTVANSDDVISLTYTPTSATNILEFEFIAPFYSTNVAAFFLFSGTSFVQGFLISGDINGDTAYFKHYMTAGTTSSTTYHVRFSIITIGENLKLLETGTNVAFFGATGNTTIQFSVKEYTS